MTFVCLFVSRGADLRGFIIPLFVLPFLNALHDLTESVSANCTKVIHSESEEMSQKMSIS